MVGDGYHVSVKGLHFSRTRSFDPVASLHSSRLANSWGHCVKGCPAWHTEGEMLKPFHSLVCSGRPTYSCCPASLACTGSSGSWGFYPLLNFSILPPRIPLIWSQISLLYAISFLLSGQYCLLLRLLWVRLVLRSIILLILFFQRKQVNFFSNSILSFYLPYFLMARVSEENSREAVKKTNRNIQKTHEKNISYSHKQGSK